MPGFKPEPLSQGLLLWQFPGTPYFPLPSSKPTWLTPISLATCYPLSRKPPGKEPLQIQFLEQGPGSSFLPSMSGLCFAQRFHRNFSCLRKTNGGTSPLPPCGSRCPSLLGETGLRGEQCAGAGLNQLKESAVSEF